MVQRDEWNAMHVNCKVKIYYRYILYVCTNKYVHLSFNLNIVKKTLNKMMNDKFIR